LLLIKGPFQPADLLFMTLKLPNIVNRTANVTSEDCFIL
jgi:hypothetical protein